MNLELFKQLDESLRSLGRSDSSIEYASHIRSEFDSVLKSLNQIKRAENVKIINDECYFDSDLGIDYSDILN